MAPRVSVIVPVRDRRDLVRSLLAALEKQTFADFEVIVVDDGSTDGTPEEVTTAIVASRPVRVLEAGGVGAVGARTIGVEASHGEILAFTDSDCVPAPCWLAAGVAAIDAGADMVNGLTRPARPPGPLERSVASGEEHLYPTCNIFYRRSTFETLGGFDLDAGKRWGFRPGRRARGLGHGEDTLLGWRVRREAVVVHEPAALVEHHVFPPDLGEWLRRGVMMGAFPAILREVPELRRSIMPRGVLFEQYSRVPFYAFVVSLVTGRRALAAMSGTAWVAANLQDLRHRAGPRGPKLRALPAKMLIDAVNAGALMAGNVRARTLVL